MERPQCSHFPLVLEQFLKQFPYLWLTGEFSVLLEHTPVHPGLGPAKLRCPSPGHQSSATPRGTGAPPSPPTCAHGCAGQGARAQPPMESIKLSQRGFLGYFSIIPDSLLRASPPSTRIPPTRERPWSTRPGRT